jgi:O-antigen ligase
VIAAIAVLSLLVALAVALAVRPVLALPLVPALVAAAVAAAKPGPTVRLLRIAIAVAAAIALTLLAAVSPPAAAACVPLLLLGAAIRSNQVLAARLAAWALAIAVMIALALAVAIVPGLLAVVAAGVALVFASAILWRPLATAARAYPVAAMSVVAAAVVALPVLVVYPVSVPLLLLVAGLLLLAIHSPAAALAGAGLMVGFEGSIKILLGLEHTPLPGGVRAAGAAAIDAALFGAVIAVVVRDRLRTPRALWARASRAERLAIAVLIGWLVLSVLQIAQGGDIVRGVQGFRLFQAYTAVALAALVVFAPPRVRLRGLQVLLGLGLVVSLYAAARVLTGPARAEHLFATDVPTTSEYGSAFRAIGSFSSAVGLVSFLAPLSVFALVAGFLDRRVRVFAWVTAGLAIVGLLGSYGRASLFGLALGLLAALALVMVAADIGRRRKLIAVGLVAGLLVGVYGGLLVASEASPALKVRARGVLNPFGDESVRLRFDNWGERIDEAVSKPLGRGIGAVGAASSPNRYRVVTTDNSYLKVLLEQGFLGLALFLSAMIATVVLLARRIRRLPGESRALALAALAGFVAFLGISFAGEYVEQPGKVLAWALLGVAVACAFGGGDASRQVGS